MKMWLKQNDTPICKGVLLQIGVRITIHNNYTPKFGVFQGVELKMLNSICNFFMICKSTIFKTKGFTDMSEQHLTGYPSIDKPWLKYYDEKVYNTPVPACTLYDHVYDRNKDHLEDIALNYFGRKFSYGQMFDIIAQCSRAFAAIGVKEGDIVTIISVSTPETICAFYALNRLGAIANMVDPRTSAEGMEHYIQEVDSRLVITIDVAIQKVRKAIEDTNVQNVIVISPYNSLPTVKKMVVNMMGMLKGKKNELPEKFLTWNDFFKLTAEPFYPAYRKDTCCVIVHTGGTTGVPKGVMLSNDNITISAHDCVYNTKEMNRKETWLNIMPPFIAYGIGPGLHLPLICGMEVILIPQFNPDEYDKLMNKHHPNHMLGAPTHYEKLIYSPKMKGKDLSYVIAPGVGGDTIKHDLENKINDWFKEHHCNYRIQKGYGMSEVSAGATFTVSDACNRVGSVGVPILHTVVSVFDPETGEELKYGEQGEICIAGPNVMLGYYNNETETNHVLRKHKDGSMWIHSGDMGYMMEDGGIFILDRIKRIIIRYDGFKVFPSQIEKIIASHPAVTCCCAVGKDDSAHKQGRLPIVFAVCEEGTNQEQVINELAELCRTKLPEYSQPTDFILVDELPLTAISKIDYRKLEEMAAKLSVE